MVAPDAVGCYFDSDSRPNLTKLDFPGVDSYRTHRQLPFGYRRHCYNQPESAARSRPVQDIPYTVHTFKEGETLTLPIPELDISSCGVTKEDAKTNIRDAVQGFLETSADMASCMRF